MEDNKFSKNNAGRPPMFESVKEIEDKINGYFESIRPIKNKDGELVFNEYPTITGLALFLGFASRQSIYEYKQKDIFTYTIKRAILAIENNYENRLFYNNPAGAIFALKNLGWKDKTEHEVSGNLQQNIINLGEGKKPEE